MLSSPAPAGDLLAIKARRAETVANGTFEHAVILVEGGKIVSIGEDLPIERGIPVLELPDDVVVLPGLVNAYSRAGLDGKGFNDSRPSILASDELYPSEAYKDVLEAGITTLGQYPAGTGIPGQAVAVNPGGSSVEEMILADKVYLKIVLRSTAGSKKMITDGFRKADDFLEKEKKNREKWEKAQEKKKKDAKKKKKKDDDDKKKDDDKEKTSARDDDDDKQKDEEEDDEYKPLPPDEDAQPFLDLRNGDLRALVSVRSAGDYLHFQDAKGEEEFEWDLRIPMTSSLDVFHVVDKIAESGARVVFEPRITLHPGTMRQRNLIAEFVKAGIEVVMIPRADYVSSFKTWLRDVGEIVAAGLDEQAALRSMTLEPAELLGLADRVGSLEVGKDANLVFVRGAPFEASTRIEAVMLGGQWVYGEVDQ